MIFNSYSLKFLKLMPLKISKVNKEILMKFTAKAKNVESILFDKDME